MLTMSSSIKLRFIVVYFKIKIMKKTFNIIALHLTKKVPNKKCREGIVIPFPAFSMLK